MIRKVKLILCVFVFSFLAFKGDVVGQLIDFDTLIYPITTTGQSFENYLVSLAWENNPEHKIYDNNINVARAEIDIAKRAWADDWSITLNLNENNLKKAEGTDGIMLQEETIMNLQTVNLEELQPILETSGQAVNVNNFPRYNFGLALNLGSLVTRGKKVAIAKENLFAEEFIKDQDRLELRSKVYKAYSAYKQTIELLKIRTKSEQTAADIFDLMKTRFKSGTIDFDEYNRSAAEYQRANEGLILAQGNMDEARLDVEGLIGIPLSLAKFYYEQNNGQ